MYVITFATCVVGTTTQKVMEALTANGDYLSVVWVDDLDAATEAVDYVEE